MFSQVNIILYLNPSLFICYTENQQSRHGILYNCSASKNRQYNGFHKISGIFSISNCNNLWRQCWIRIKIMHFFVCGSPSRNWIPFINLILTSFSRINLMISIYPSTIWDEFSASYTYKLTQNSMSVYQSPVKLLRHHYLQLKLICSAYRHTDTHQYPAYSIHITLTIHISQPT